MALKFQYNKTYLQQLNKELRVRENALPTLQAKESALRMEVKKARDEARQLERELEDKMRELSAIRRLWSEFEPGLISVKNIILETRKVAGVKTPVLAGMEFSVAGYSLVAAAAWFPPGIEVLKTLSALRIRRDLAHTKVQALEFARKKTTQKVNLYEKVQIPDYQEAIRKIKRFLEDEENLAKSSQKILKARIAALEAVA